MATALKVTFLVLLIAVSSNAQLYEGDKCNRNDGSPGVCKNIENCQKAKDELDKGIVPTICGFKNRLPIVCCPESQPVIQPTPKPVTPVGTPKPTPPSSKPDNTRSKSKQKCKEYSAFVYSKVGGGVAPLLPDAEPDKGTNQCVDGSKLIIGGVEAERKEFPHMALVGFGEKDSVVWGCGGSLISEKFVLTAAHCLSARELGLAKWIRLGDLNIKTTEDRVDTQDFSIANKFRHPDYTPPGHYNDIALLELDRNARFDGYVRPACMHTEESVPNELLIASGWGLTDWVGATSDELRKVGLNNVDPAICNDTFGPLIGGRKLRIGITSDSMLCVGDLAGGKDTCKGDSGGPLQVKLANPYCMYDVVGVTSFGNICGAKNSPAVYTRVSHFIPWIESIVWP